MRQIHDAKLKVKSILKQVLSENSGDVVHEELKFSDESGDVDISEICCSRCGTNLSKFLTFLIENSE